MTQGQSGFCFAQGYGGLPAQPSDSLCLHARRTFRTGYHVFECITRHLALTINTAIYYVLSDDLRGYMFRPLSGHLQCVKLHKIKITRLFCMVR